jgi:hypothetical protein
MRVVSVVGRPAKPAAKRKRYSLRRFGIAATDVGCRRSAPNARYPKSGYVRTVDMSQQLAATLILGCGRGPTIFWDAACVRGNLLASPERALIQMGDWCGFHADTNRKEDLGCVGIPQRCPSTRNTKKYRRGAC